MGLYLVEVDIDVSTPEKRAAIMERIEEVITNKGTGTAKLVAGSQLSQHAACHTSLSIACGRFHGAQ